MQMKGITILLADDEPDIIKWMKRDLESQSFAVHTAFSGPEALEIMKNNHIDILLADIKMPGMDGIELIKQARGLNPDLPCIVFTGHGDLDTARETIKLSIIDYLLKPVDKQELFSAIQKAIDSKEKQHLIHKAMEGLVSQNDQGSRIENGGKTGSGHIVGQSQAIKVVFELIAQVSTSDSTVLITGESGTGKELVAKAIHESSHRSQGPFIVVNCAAIPSELLESELFGHVRGAYTGAIRDSKGKFEEANQGTIFLDEVGDMPMGAQAKILRVLQDKKGDKGGG